MISTADLIAANAKHWASVKIDPSRLPEARSTALRLIGKKAAFVGVEARTMVLWFAGAIIGERECGPDPKFELNLAQGDRWDRRSVHVPAGRGPFSSWDEAAYDAFMNCPPYAGHWRDWSPGGVLTLWEKYNGIGYAVKGVPSPYNWAATNQYVSGKYVRDGVYDPAFVDKQLGCAAMLTAMMEIDPSITFGPDVPSHRDGPPPKNIIDDATKAARTVRKAAAGGGAAIGANEGAKTGTQVPTAPVPITLAYAGIGVAIAVVIVATVLIARRKAAVLEAWF